MAIELSALGRARKKVRCENARHVLKDLLGRLITSLLLVNQVECKPEHLDKHSALKPPRARLIALVIERGLQPDDIIPQRVLDSARLPPLRAV